MKYCCGWCDAPIKKGMRCASIYHPSECYWAGRVAIVGVKQAIRESLDRVAKRGYFISDAAIAELPPAIATDRETEVNQ